jgi:hypothetical protein
MNKLEMMVIIFAGSRQGIKIINGLTILTLKNGVISELSVTWYLYSGIIMLNQLKL